MSGYSAPFTAAPTPTDPTPPIRGYTMNVAMPRSNNAPTVAGPRFPSARVPGSLKRQAEGRLNPSSKLRYGSATEQDIASITGVSGNILPPQSSNAYPSVAQWSSGNAAAVMSNIPGVSAVDETYRNITPMGPRPGGVWNNMPMDPGNVFQNFIGNRADNSASIIQGPSPFISTGAQQGLPGNTLYPWEQANRHQSRTDESGVPDPRTKITLMLSKESATFAVNTLAYQPIFAVQTVLPTDPAAGVWKGRYSKYESTLYDLVVTNYKLALMQKRASHPGEVKSTTDILKIFHYLGIVAAEEGNQTSYSDAQPLNNKLNRNVVVTLGGNVFDAINYWSDALDHASSLGFILKGVPLDLIVPREGAAKGSYILNPASSTHITTVDYRECASVILQFVPWSGPAWSSPSHKELLYVDEFGKEKIGVFIPVGQHMQYHGSRGDARSISRAWCSRYAGMHAGSIAILASRQEVLF